MSGMILHHLSSKLYIVLLLSILSSSNYYPNLIILVSASSSSSSNFKCFEDRDELKNAIDSCFKGGEGAVSNYGTTVQISANERDCSNVKAKYGWPINGWCTGEVTNMHFLFSEKRDFNEGDI